ncbi:hypothetical protein HMPREF0653_02189 [Prevotella disiens JCM 6334 = ATCC 29426]|uniref:Uncharacterized protein n=1 Tax=Prevotella disiens JCM 6334 = ATCC 29426 TaxID=1235811 RepID=A0ABN0NQ13_9BACT|nr:hypothetical protein HMPREF0653_02189 [Prevotella disiens JCM 6334 = ATCC 29426]
MPNECSYIFYKEIANERKENLFSLVGAWFTTFLTTCVWFAY